MKKYDYWFAKRWEIPCSKKEKMLEEFGDTKSIYHADKEKIEQIQWMTELEKSNIIKAQKEVPEKELDKFLKSGGNFTTIHQKEYPARLKKIYSKPYALFYYGSLPDEQKKSIGIVGARNCSAYGRACAADFSKAFADAGISIISGMAKGIDSQASVSAIDEGGYSAAILGCGIDICYPASSQELYWRLKMQGGIISEYPIGTSPRAQNFPARNRIISGLSDMVLVVEAREKSGSLITADFALEQGKDVYAIPGRLSDPMSKGCNQLIRQGAGIVTGISDLLQEIGVDILQNINNNKKNRNSLAKEEKLLYSCVDLNPKNIDEIVEMTNMPTGEVINILLNLQLKGYISEISRNYYVRTTLKVNI